MRKQPWSFSIKGRTRLDGVELEKCGGEHGIRQGRTRQGAKADTRTWEGKKGKKRTIQNVPLPKELCIPQKEIILCMRLPLIILDWFIYLLFSTRVRKRFGKLLPYVFFLFEQLRTARHCFKLLQFSKSMASHFLRLSSVGAFDLRTEEYHLLNDYRELNLSLDACCREISRVA